MAPELGGADRGCVGCELAIGFALRAIFCCLLHVGGKLPGSPGIAGGRVLTLREISTLN